MSTHRRFDPGRRALLMMALAAPVAAQAATGAPAGAAQGVCVDMDLLPRSQKAMRASLGFKMVTEDPKRRCDGCAFYTAKEGSCGACELLTGAPVPAEGRCDSWAARK